MAITARTANECFERFRGHVGALVGEMLPTNCPMLCMRGKAQEKRTLSFSCPDTMDAVPLETSAHGTIYLYMAQELQTFPEGRQHRLSTVKYWYKLYTDDPSIKDDAFVRWEYETVAPGSTGHPRHHMQFGKMVRPQSFGAGEFDFTRFHMPTGWVTMEEIFRFLVHEFGVQPPCGERWPSVLGESEEAFYKSFTDKGASGLKK
jgi:hypothetical protein